MPFAPPSVRTEYRNPGDELEPMVRYIITLVSLEDQGVSQFEKDKNKPDAEHTYLWKWNVHNDDGMPVLDDDNKLWEFWEWTSNRTGYRQDGTPGKPRARFQALVGRDLTDEEMSRFVSDENNIARLPGRRAYATFHRVKGKNREGDDVLKPAIQSLMPWKGRQPAGPPPPPPPEPVADKTDDLAF